MLIEGRRLHGTVTDFADEKPMANISVESYNSARPRSGAASLGTTTDDSGSFELFVPPAPPTCTAADALQAPKVLSIRRPGHRSYPFPESPRTNRRLSTRKARLPSKSRPESE